MTTFLAAVDAMFVRDPSDWRHAAACRDEDPELFFAVGRSPAANAQRYAAKAVCACCPVVGACRDWAFASGEYEGVWGGLDEFQRQEMRRAQAPPPKPREHQPNRRNRQWPTRPDAQV